MPPATFSSGMCGGWMYLLQFFLMVLAFTKYYVLAEGLIPPAQNFNRFRILQPILYHGITKREITSTRDTNGVHHSDVMITVPGVGEDLLLDLKLNHDLVPGDHTLQYQEGGKTVKLKPKKEELDLCHYSGSVRGKDGSWVAVSTCHGVSGVIFDGQKMRYIEPAQGGEIQPQHFLYDHNDLNADYHCGSHDGVTNNTQYDPELMARYKAQKEINKSRISRYKRETDDTQVRGPYNSNELSRYVELVLVADRGEYIANGEDIHTVLSQMIQLANIIHSFYSPLNIYITLVGVVVWTELDEISLEDDGTTTLNNFLKYRKNLNVDIPNDNAQLLTHHQFTNGVVARALKGVMCTFEYSGAVNTNHSRVIGLVATTIAHSMGHNFGIEHDTEECECPEQRCIMSSSISSVVPTHWSSCSLEYLKMYSEKGLDYCLHNKPKRLFGSPTCGNGFIEPGEQCDCGIGIGEVVNALCNACCNGQTCMLRGNATCSAGDCCDPQTCQQRIAGTSCRAANKECDLPEYCTGHSEFCPADVHKMDTTPCGKGDNQAYCVRGSCNSHSDQCRLLWGSTGQNSHLKCYTNNINGNRHGNCGFDRIHQTYKPCAPDDALCGMLQCRHLSEQLEFGIESTSILSNAFLKVNETIIPCRTAIIDVGVSDVDPGLVPDGARCGDGRMCLKQRCVSIASVREEISKGESSVCPSDCSGHGVCNSKGHCHCEVGFTPPLCTVVNSGGFVDSGPVTTAISQTSTPEVTGANITMVLPCQ